jgi:hypothetical protein
MPSGKQEDPFSLILRSLFTLDLSKGKNSRQPVISVTEIAISKLLDSLFRGNDE